jgi:two-component system LytT family response regulator
MMVNCMIVDDEPLAQQVLEKYIAQCPPLRLVMKCFNAAEAFDALHQQTIDLLFLDIKMPVIKGTDFIRSLKQPPAFIFTTAYAEFAAQSYELEAVDYLLKPVTFNRFQKAVDRFLKLHTVPQAPEKEYIYIKESGKLVKVMLADILYAESMKDYIRLKTIKEQLLTHMTMKALEELLPADRFVRVHRSFMVNLQHVAVIGKNELTVDALTIPIGANYKDKLPPRLQ